MYIYEEDKIIQDTCNNYPFLIFKYDKKGYNKYYFDFLLLGILMINSKMFNILKTTEQEKNFKDNINKYSILYHKYINTIIAFIRITDNHMNYDPTSECAFLEKIVSYMDMIKDEILCRTNQKKITNQKFKEKITNQKFKEKITNQKFKEKITNQKFKEKITNQKFKENIHNIESININIFI